MWSGVDDLSGSIRKIFRLSTSTCSKTGSRGHFAMPRSVGRTRLLVSHPPVAKPVRRLGCVLGKILVTSRAAHSRLTSLRSSSQASCMRCRIRIASYPVFLDNRFPKKMETCSLCDRISTDSTLRWNMGGNQTSFCPECLIPGIFEGKSIKRSYLRHNLAP